jgi:hypothetical protein
MDRRNLGEIASASAGLSKIPWQGSGEDGREDSQTALPIKVTFITGRIRGAWKLAGFEGRSTQNQRSRRSRSCEEDEDDAAMAMEASSFFLASAFYQEEERF